MDIYGVLALFAGFLIAVSAVPQLIKIVRTKEVEDISFLMFVLIFLTQFVWIVYGIHIGDLPIVVTNILSMMVVLSNIFLIVRYRKR